MEHREDSGEMVARRSSRATDHAGAECNDEETREEPNSVSSRNFAKNRVLDRSCFKNSDDRVNCALGNAKLATSFAVS